MHTSPSLHDKHVPCVHEQTFRITWIMRDKLLSQAHSLVTQPRNVRCRVSASLIPPLFGAWPQGSVEMFPTSVPPAATDVSQLSPQTYISCSL